MCNCLHNGGCAHYVIVSKVQWKPFWLATQLYPQNDWLGVPYTMTYAPPPPPPPIIMLTLSYSKKEEILFFFVIAKIAQGSSMNFVRSLLFSAYYRKRGSASYIVHEVRSVRERDGSDVTLVALKLAMNFALFLAKMCTLVLAKSFARFLAKNFHLFLRLPS